MTAKLEEKQTQLKQLLYMQQLLEQIYRHQTHSLLLNQSWFQQELMG